MHIVIASRGMSPIPILLAFRSANLFHEHAEIRVSHDFWELLRAYPATSEGNLQLCLIIGKGNLKFKRCFRHRSSMVI